LRNLIAYKLIFLLLFVISSKIVLANEYDEIKTINCEAEFYWKELLSPENIDSSKASSIKVNIPSSWTNYTLPSGEKPKKEGYGTYRFWIETDEENQSLVIPKLWSASKVWVNGELVSKRGEISQTENTKPMMVEDLVALSKSSKYEVIVQISNEVLFNGGIVKPFKIGFTGSILKKEKVNNIKELLWIGAILIMSFYHFIIFFFRRSNKPALFFGIFCLLIVLKLISFGENYIYQYLKLEAGLSFNWQSKIYYLSSFMLFPIGLLYIKSLYVENSKNAIIKWFSIISFAYGIFILLTNVMLFTSTLRYFQIVIALGIIYIIYLLFKASRNRKTEAYAQLFGIFAMLFASANDILHSTNIKLTPYGEIIPIAFALFLLMQIYIVAKRFTNAFKEVEDLSKNLELKVQLRTQEIEKQKEQLAEKNTEIVDSITYAKRLQDAILPSDTAWKEKLPNSFILYKPKDIVAGDFYWMKEVNENILFAAADCTGHGVPGAMVSMVCSNALNRVIDEYNVSSPSKILDKTTELVVDTFAKSDKNVRDGMDVSLCNFNPNTLELSWAGANNPLILIRNGELIEYKADKQPVGYFSEKNDFTNHKIQLQLGDIIYLYSDGFADQFGGEKGKKYKTGRFKEYLVSISSKEIETQKELLEEEFNNWKASLEQLDDVCVIGVRI